MGGVVEVVHLIGVMDVVEEQVGVVLADGESVVVGGDSAKDGSGVIGTLCRFFFADVHDELRLGFEAFFHREWLGPGFGLSRWWGRQSLQVRVWMA